MQTDAQTDADRDPGDLIIVTVISKTRDVYAVANRIACGVFREGGFACTGFPGNCTKCNMANLTTDERQSLQTRLIEILSNGGDVTVGDLMQIILGVPGYASHGED